MRSTTWGLAFGWAVACCLTGAATGAGAEDIEPNCSNENALSICLEPQTEFLAPEPSNGKSRYVAAGVRYFLTMKTDQRDWVTIAADAEERVQDYRRPLEPGEWNPINRWFRATTIHPRYSPLVIRYEFPPWLLTTGYGAVTMKTVDEALRIYTTDYKSIECRFFETQPFARCHVVFLYGTDNPDTDEDDRTECPIYEEFTFNNQGQTTFIEAWTDHEGYLPMDPDDYWAQGTDVKRLSTSVPGLGNATGRIDPTSQAMKRAAATFDSHFQAPYWNESHHEVGPFTSMLDDLNGTINGTWVPGGQLLSIWPNWTRRTLEHLGGNVLDGCRRPPGDAQH